MHFAKITVALLVAMASNASAAPVEDRARDLSIEDYNSLSARVPFSKTGAAVWTGAAAVASALSGWVYYKAKNNKEAEDFLASDEGKAFISKMAIDLVEKRDLSARGYDIGSISARDPFSKTGAAVWGGATLVASALSALVIAAERKAKTKEAEDIIASDEGMAFVSKLAADLGGDF